MSKKLSGKPCKTRPSHPCAASSKRNTRLHQHWTQEEINLVREGVKAILGSQAESSCSADSHLTSLTEVAKRLSEIIGRPVGRRRVQEVLRELRQDNPADTFRVMPRGRPKRPVETTPAGMQIREQAPSAGPSPTSRRPVIAADIGIAEGDPSQQSSPHGVSTTPSDDPFALICCEAIQLTGLSARALHALLEPWQAIGPYLKSRSSFYQRLATSGRRRPSRRAKRKPRWITSAPAKELVHELHVYQIVLNDKQILRAWLLAYDIQTRYIFAWCYKIKLGDLYSDGGWLVALPTSDIVHFVKRAWERQGIFPNLPIIFTLSKTLQQSDEDIREFTRLAPQFRFRISEFDEHQYIPQKLAESFTAGRLQESVRSFLNSYNNAIARPEIEAWREERAQDRRQLTEIQEPPGNVIVPNASRRRRAPYSSLEEMNIEDQMFPSRTKDTFNQACTPEDISIKFIESSIGSQKKFERLMM